MLGIKVVTCKLSPLTSLTAIYPLVINLSVSFDFNVLDFYKKTICLGIFRLLTNGVVMISSWYRELG